VLRGALKDLASSGAKRLLNEGIAQTFYKKTVQQIKKFLKGKDISVHKELEVAAKERSKEILEIIRRKIGGE